MSACKERHTFGEDLGTGRSRECVLAKGHDGAHHDIEARWWTVTRAGPIPVATHTAEIEFGGMKVKVHVLDNGQRVVDADDFKKVLEWLAGGTL